MAVVALLDVEGTLGDAAFVREVLFPYARAALPRFVAERGNEPAVRRELEAVARESGVGADDPQGLVRVLEGWIDADRKITALKNLQGMIWAGGYAAGAFRAPVYADALRCLRRWRRRGVGLHVYSSGSIAAQQLYFRHTEHGDLRALFDGHFDTTVGPKREVSSYRRIAERLGTEAARIVFLSDTVEELDAAAAAGLGTVHVRRAGPRGSGSHPEVRSFEEVELEGLAG